MDLLNKLALTDIDPAMLAQVRTLFDERLPISDISASLELQDPVMPESAPLAYFSPVSARTQTNTVEI